MNLPYETDTPTRTTLILRGLAFTVVATAVVAAGIARSQGTFEASVHVTAEMSDLGDGLPPRSDVKYRGVLVGTVAEVLPAADGAPTRVRLDLKPRHAHGIPETVTARVVPSNVFAVPSLQLVDNGAGSPLRAGARIPEDRGLATVQLQTSLTALSRITAAAGRSPTDPTVGILETVQRATSGRGADAAHAAVQLERIVTALSELTEPDGSTSTLEALRAAIDGLRTSSPDLLAAVNQAVVPMRAVAAQRVGLARLMSGGLVTTGTVADAMAHHTDTILAITSDMGPVLEVLGAGSRNFTQMTTSQRLLAERVGQVLWRPESQSAVPKIIVELTPHKQYTREDCPRYGELAGPSCVTGPPGPGVLGTTDTAAPAPIPAADTGSAGSAPDPAGLARIPAGTPEALSILLLGALVRGTETPATSGGPR